MRERINQKDMKTADWKDFIAAIRGMHGAGASKPAYREFVDLHVDAFDMPNMSWGVHTMGIKRGRNFLAWHRQYLFLMEERLRKEKPNVTIPYWDSVTDRKIPDALTDPTLLSELSVGRSWNPSWLADSRDLNAVISFIGSLTGFQSLIEGAVHGGTHNAVGGNMARASSPADPVFWLHHAFIDKLWADWQASPNGDNPPNLQENLMPSTFSTGIPYSIQISEIVNISDLDYSYK